MREPKRHPKYQILREMTPEEKKDFDKNELPGHIDAYYKKVGRPNPNSKKGS